MDLLELIKERRSIRAYTNKKISKKKNEFKKCVVPQKRSVDEIVHCETF